MRPIGNLVWDANTVTCTEWESELNPGDLCFSYVLLTDSFLYILRDTEDEAKKVVQARRKVGEDSVVRCMKVYYNAIS